MPKLFLRRYFLGGWLLLLTSGCGDNASVSAVLQPDRPIIRSWEYVDGFPGKIAVFDTVFWEPRDTESLRELIRTTSLVEGRDVLEIGTGSGLVAIACLKAGAARVVATDVNSLAIENARYNAQMLDVFDRLEVRQVPLQEPGAFSVIATDERFDLIVSNPPWEDQPPREISEYALYDAQFTLLESLLSGLRQHLLPGGKALLAYGCVSAIRQIQELAPQHGLRVQVLDDRPLDQLPEVFLPGMLLEVTPQLETQQEE